MLGSAVRRVLARRPLPSLRRPMSDGPNRFEEQISKLSEAERAQMSKWLDEMDAEFQGKLEQHLNEYLQRPTFFNDKGRINRMLTFCRVPKGQRREDYIWYPTFGATLLVSLALGIRETRRCLQHYFGSGEEQEQGTTTNADLGQYP